MNIHRHINARFNTSKEDPGARREAGGGGWGCRQRRYDVKRVFGKHARAHTETHTHTHTHTHTETHTHTHTHPTTTTHTTPPPHTHHHHHHRHHQQQQHPRLPQNGHFRLPRLHLDFFWTTPSFICAYLYTDVHILCRLLLPRICHFPVRNLVSYNCWHFSHIRICCCA